MGEIAPFEEVNFFLGVEGLGAEDLEEERVGERRRRVGEWRLRVPDWERVLVMEATRSMSPSSKAAAAAPMWGLAWNRGLPWRIAFPRTYKDLIFLTSWVAKTRALTLWRNQTRF
ncbi:hypothetical protein RchiOBHm_Chr1g0361781 [Rosa chinensis]|uniref:Uncharacterized protein n=1 Tax=Rosa chinensis TaxID=74649 RepID=A0A2P6SJ20_ROSCH|nr:hypothetical protein RchiOBHm_Chr1g0361781 [Rosa chinensis]